MTARTWVDGAFLLMKELGEGYGGDRVMRREGSRAAGGEGRILRVETTLASVLDDELFSLSLGRV